MVPRAERGVNIRDQGLRWGEERRIRILSHSPSEAIRVTTQETLEIFRYPPLAEEDKRKYTVRFNPFTGEIYVPIWRGRIVVNKEGKRVLESGRPLIQLLRPREHQVDFTNLPPREVVQLYYPCLPDIESAIRQQIHIMEKYQDEGGEVKQIEELMNWLNFQWLATAGRINKDSLEELARQTADFLERFGFSTAKDPTKKRIAETLRRVYQLDSRGRVNPLVIRTRLRSAYLKAIEREILPVLVSEKFTSFLGILLMEREITRRIIQEAAETLDTMVGITKRESAIFKENPPKFSFGELEGIEKVLRTVAECLAQVRVSPYLPAARIAAINLVGCREEKRELNKRIIGPQADRLFTILPVVELVYLKYFKEAKERIRNFSYNPLMETLKQNEEIGKEIHF